MSVPTRTLCDTCGDEGHTMHRGIRAAACLAAVTLAAAGCTADTGSDADATAENAAAEDTTSDAPADDEPAEEETTEEESESPSPEPEPEPSPEPTFEVVDGPIVADATKVNWDTMMSDPPDSLPGLIEVFSGTGDDVIDLQEPLGIVLLQAHHTGSSNFIVRAARADGSGDGVINTIGAYTGEALTYTNGTDTVGFDVQADGAWVLVASNLMTAGDGDDVARTYEGTGDAVIGFPVDFEDPMPVTEFSRVTLTHEGGSNFIVRGMLGGGLVNDIGPYDGTVRLPADGLFGLEISADGPWTVEFE